MPKGKLRVRAWRFFALRGSGKCVAGMEPARVLLDEPDDDWEPALTAFEQANETAIEQFRGYLAAKLREIMAVQYVYSNTPAWDGDGPQNIMPVAQRLSDIQE